MQLMYRYETIEIQFIKETVVKYPPPLDAEVEDKIT
jgi:hypothetical protein